MFRRIAFKCSEISNIVIECIDVDCGASQVGYHGQVQCSVIDTTEIAGSRRLVILGFESEGVRVDTSGCWDVGVVLVWLHQIEVRSVPDGEPVVTVQLKLGVDDWVDLSGSGCIWNGVGRKRVRTHVGVCEDYPQDFFNRVIEVQPDLVGLSGYGFSTSELQLLDQVLVRHLGESPPLICVEVHVIYVQGTVSHGPAGNCDGSAATRCCLNQQTCERCEFDIDFNLVISCSNALEKHYLNPILFHRMGEDCILNVYFKTSITVQSLRRHHIHLKT